MEGAFAALTITGADIINVRCKAGYEAIAVRVTRKPKSPPKLTKRGVSYEELSWATSSLKSGATSSTDCSSKGLSKWSAAASQGGKPQLSFYGDNVTFSVPANVRSDGQELHVLLHSDVSLVRLEKFVIAWSEPDGAYSVAKMQPSGRPQREKTSSRESRCSTEAPLATILSEQASMSHGGSHGGSSEESLHVVKAPSVTKRLPMKHCNAMPTKPRISI